MNTATDKSIRLVALLNRRAKVARLVVRGDYNHHYYFLS